MAYYYDTVVYDGVFDLQKSLNNLLEKDMHYVGILHDKDKEDDHFHFIIRSEKDYAFAFVKDLFVTETNVFTMYVKDLKKAFQYLIHKNHKNKHQYDESEMFSDDLKKWDVYLREGFVFEDNFIKDLLTDDSEFSLQRMAQKYGRDFIKNYRTYREFRNEVLSEKRQEEIAYNEYLALVEKQNQLAKARNTEINMIMKLFPNITREEIGDRKIEFYKRCYDWCRRFKRDAKYTYVYTYMLLALPEEDRIYYENLIYKRQNAGRIMTFSDVDHTELTIREMMNVDQRCFTEFRYNIYIRPSAPNKLTELVNKKSN